jgi:hypothetical protein
MLPLGLHRRQIPILRSQIYRNAVLKGHTNVVNSRYHYFFNQEMQMAKKVLFCGMISIVLTFGMVLTGCESLAEGILNGMSNANSAATDAGQIYYFYNESSYTVTIIDPTGSLTIPPRGSTQIRYNRQVSIYSVEYSPVDSVIPSQSSVTHITFRDR